MQNPTNTTTVPRKKIGTGWKVTGGIAATILVFGMATSGGDDTATVIADAGTQSEPTAQVADKIAEPAAQPVAEPIEATHDVPREHQQALKQAESYLAIMPFSYDGLYEQLTSEYGSGFPADAAQYALDNVDVDWNAEAVEAAESYLETMPFSRDSLLDQLTSEYGSGFTPEQAQYAVDTVY